MGADRAVAAVECRVGVVTRSAQNRRVVEGIIYRYRTGMAWRDLPAEVFGPWQTVWKRHRRYAGDGTWDKVLTELLAQADAAGEAGLDGVGGLHDQPGSPARDEHAPPRAGHGGLGRITRICRPGSSPARWAVNANPQVTASVAPVVG